MKGRRVLIILSICISLVGFAQKGQKVAYIDMNYILENVPEYVNAQSRLDEKVISWQLKLDELSGEIDVLKTDLSNEKSLLTKELINEREEDIQIKENELRRLQIAYFGPTGDLFQLRKQFAKPVQDQVYNAIQEIAKRKKYDFVLDKSSDLIMLYSNSKYDISELVLNSIVKDRKQKIIEDRKTDRMAKAGVVKSSNVDPDEFETVSSDGYTVGQVTDSVQVEKSPQQKKIDERNAKREALKEKIRAQQEARIQMRDSLKKDADEKRAAKLKEIEDRKKKREEELENKD